MSQESLRLGMLARGPPVTTGQKLMNAAEPKFPVIVFNERDHPRTMPDMCFELGQVPRCGPYGPGRGQGKFLLDAEGRCWITHKRAGFPKGTSAWGRLLGSFQKRFEFEQVDTMQWNEVQDRLILAVTKELEPDMDGAEFDAAAELAKDTATIKAARNLEDLADFFLENDWC